MRLPRSKTPKWAETIVREVWANQYGRRPVITWQTGARRRDGATYTSGFCSYYNEITINVRGDSPRWEQKMVLLHELAHAIDGCTGHGYRFWLTAWTLFRRYHLPVRKVQKRGSDRGAARRARLATSPGATCPRAADRPQLAA